MLTPNWWLDRVYDEGDHKVAVLRNEYTERLEELRRRLQGRGRKRQHPERPGLYRELKDRSINHGDTDINTLFDNQPQPVLSESLGGSRFALFRTGDCISPHNIHGAIYDSLRLCKDF